MPKKQNPKSNQNNLIEKLHSLLMEKNSFYADWHDHPHQHKVQMIIFVLVLAMVGGLIALKFQSFPKINPLQTRADSEQYWMEQESKIADNTKNLLNLVQDYRKADSDEREELLPMMKDTAQQRFYMIAAASEKRPEVVLHTAIPGSLRRNMPAEISQYVEEEVNKTGKLDWKIADDFATGSSKHDISLIDSNGQNLKLQFTDQTKLPHALSGDRVKVNGIQVVDRIVVGSSASGVQVLGATTAPQVKKVAMILFNFRNNPSQPYPVTEARSSIFTGANSVNSYYRETSFDQLSMTGALRADGDVFGWYTIPYDYNVDCPGNYGGNWTAAAEQAAARDGFNVANYSSVIYGFPQGQCGWSGIANVGGAPARAWINDNGITSSGQPTFLPIGTVTHEFGHNLGRMHASLLNCTDATGVRVSMSDTCSNASEYGDLYNVMGRWGAMKQMHAFHKGLSNGTQTNSWLSSSNSQTVATGANTTYTLAPTETNTDALQVLRIPKILTLNGSSIYGYYYLDFRQPIGYDNGNPADAIYNGVSIHFGVDYNTSTAGYLNSYLIDTTPGTYDWNDAALGAGQTFTDISDSLTITVQSVSAAGAVVQVSYSGNPCLAVAPTITVAPTSVTTSAGLSTTFTYTLKDNNPANCGASNYDLRTALPTGWLQTPAAITDTLMPGASVSRTVVVTSDPNASSGSNLITFQAIRQNGGQLGQAYASYTVQGVDRTPPFVRITKPVDGYRVGKGKLNITATATDNVYVTSIKLYIDSTLIKTCVNSGSCSGSASTNQLSTGTHIVKAVAGDYAGNSSTTTISITK